MAELAARGGRRGGGRRGGEEEGREEERDESYADFIWKEISSIKLKMPTIGVFFLNLGSFMLQVAPTWFDVGSDWVAGMSYLLSEDYTWACLTLVLTILPGLVWSSKRSWMTDGQKKWQLPFFLSCLFYPLFLASYKLLTWLTDGEWMKFVAPMVTVVEVTFEALPQLALQVFIVLRSPDVTPGWTQLASIISSFLTATLGPAEDFLAGRTAQWCQQGKATKELYEMTLREKVPLIARFLPFFLSMTISRILAISLATSLLHHYALALYLPTIAGLVIFYNLFITRRYKMPLCQLLQKRGWECLMTPLRSMVTNTNDEMFPELLFQLFWSFFNLSLCFLAALLYTGDREVLLAGSPKHINVTVVVAILVTIWVLTISTLFFYWAAGINDQWQKPAPAPAHPASHSAPPTPLGSDSDSDSECGGGSTLEHTPCSTTLPSLPSSLLSSLTAQPRISRRLPMAEAKAGQFLTGARVPPHPYTPPNSACTPVSRQDSEPQSVSSHNDTTDDNGSSFTESSSHYSSYREGGNGGHGSSALPVTTFIPRTARVPTEASNQLPPGEFAAVLSQKLEKLKREQDLDEKLTVQCRIIDERKF